MGVRTWESKSWVWWLHSHEESYPWQAFESNQNRPPPSLSSHRDKLNWYGKTKLHIYFYQCISQSVGSKILLVGFARLSFCSYHGARKYVLKSRSNSIELKILLRKTVNSILWFGRLSTRFGNIDFEGLTLLLVSFNLNLNLIQHRYALTLTSRGVQRLNSKDRLVEVKDGYILDLANIYNINCYPFCFNIFIKSTFISNNEVKKPIIKAFFLSLFRNKWFLYQHQ